MDLGCSKWEAALSVTVVILMAWIRAEVYENRYLRAELKGAYSVMDSMQCSAPVAAAGSDSACARWLFDTDLEKAKARICGKPMQPAR